MFFPSLGLIATTNVTMIDIHESVNAALKKMNVKRHRSIVVTSGLLNYILTTKEIIRLKVEGADFTVPLSQIRLRPLPTINKESNIINALNLTNETDEHIAVSNSDGSFYGLVTNSDIVASVDPQLVLESLQIATIFDKKYGFKSFTVQCPMSDVLAYMKDAMSDCVIIEENGAPAGIITSKDILRFIGEHRSGTIPASQMMSSPIVTLSSTASISEGLAFLKQKNFKRIVVTGTDEKVMGIVTQQDLISRTYLKWSQLMQDHFRQFEEITQILQQKNQHLAQLATKDALTDIHNRHMFMEVFTKELANIKRHTEKLSLIMLDLDHFKKINDSFGHNIGDYVLKKFAQTAASAVREADFFARWGGEEFVLLLRNTSCEEGYVVGEKIRSILEKTLFEDVGQVTCSVGVTEVYAEDTIASAISRADEALYVAKKSGRNRTKKWSMDCRNDQQVSEVEVVYGNA